MNKIIALVQRTTVAQSIPPAILKSGTGVGITTDGVWDKFKTKIHGTEDFSSRQIPVHAKADKIPGKVTDIRGVASEAYPFMRRKEYQKGAQDLVKDQFVLLTFYPATHPIGALRKSNVAYMFNNYGTSMFNNPGIAKDFKNYKGRLSKSDKFFRTNHDPLRTAVMRTRFRKLVKTLLFEALIDKDPFVVRGVYMFRFKRYPSSLNDKETLRKHISEAVTKVKTCEELYYEPHLVDRLLKLVRRHRFPPVLRGYTEKFPFLARPSGFRRSSSRTRP